MKELKWLTPLLLVAAVTATPAFADPFDNTMGLIDQAFEQQDQMFAAEVRNQDQAYEAYTEEINHAWKRYSAEIEAIWGSENSKKPSKKAWVTYSDKRDERSSIDFEKGEVQVDILLELGEDPQSLQVQARIENRLEDIIIQPAKEDKSLKVALPPESAALSASSVLIHPLEGQLELSNGSVVTKSNATIFAKEVIKSKSLKSKIIQTPKGKKQVVSVSVSLIADHVKKRAQPYLGLVQDMAQRYKIPMSLIFAIIQTESSFNPMARSNVPAYGLMQLVPRSGGRDAYEYVFKNDKIVSGDYLYKPENNIELGSAYLKLLQVREMKRIINPKSRMLCAIAAYNTGGGNVAKAFIPGSHSIAKASVIINAMSYDQIYEHLRTNLPYKETQRYIKKVRKHMKNFAKLDGA